MAKKSTKKSEPKAKHWIEEFCPKDLSPKGFAEYILANTQNFQGGVGPEIDLAKEWLNKNK